jgi:4-azaleucine resistance transporter AzlC
MEKQLNSNIKEGILSASPVVIGYLPVSIAFGLLAKNTGISFVDTGLFSIIVFAGASQFMALDLISAGVSAGSIILSTFLLNLRHLMMTASLSVKMDNIKKPYLPIIAYGITDETFSVLSFKEGQLSLLYILTVNILSNLSWVLGTIIGFLVGEIIPKALQSSLSIGLYAMFVSLLFPNFKKENKILILSILTAIIYILIFTTKIFTSGWDIVIGIILSSALGVCIFNKDKEVEENE